MLTLSKKLLTKEKEITARIITYDYAKRKFVVQMENGKTDSISWDDMTIYQKEISNDRTIYSLLGTYIKCLYIKNAFSYIISRKEYMQKRIAKYKKGDVVKVTVVSASNDALYVQFDEGLNGKIYTNQLTSSQVRNNLDLYSIGDEIECKITKIKEDGYFEFSRIAMYKDKLLDLKHGDKLRCRITKLLDNKSGFFVEVLNNPSYSGIFDLNFYNKDKTYKIGEIIDLKVIRVDNGKKLHLSTFPQY